MRFLLISCIVFLVVACTSYPKKQNFVPVESTKGFIVNPYFSDVSKDYVYKANIEVYDNSLGGLLIIKKIDNKHYRIAFTTEMGNKLFDFSFINDEFKVNYCIDELNRKPLLHVLKKDFNTLIAENLNTKHQFKWNNSHVYETELYHKTHFYFLSNQLNKIVRVGHGKEKVIFNFKTINENVVSEINIIHNNIKLSIALKII